MILENNDKDLFMPSFAPLVAPQRSSLITYFRLNEEIHPLSQDLFAFLNSRDFKIDSFCRHDTAGHHELVFFYNKERYSVALKDSSRLDEAIASFFEPVLKSELAASGGGVSAGGGEIFRLAQEAREREYAMISSAAGSIEAGLPAEAAVVVLSPPMPAAPDMSVAMPAPSEPLPSVKIRCAAYADELFRLEGRGSADDLARMLELQKSIRTLDKREFSVVDGMELDLLRVRLRALQEEFEVAGAYKEVLKDVCGRAGAELDRLNSLIGKRRALRDHLVAKKERLACALDAAMEKSFKPKWRPGQEAFQRPRVCLPDVEVPARSAPPPVECFIPSVPSIPSRPLFDILDLGPFSAEVGELITLLNDWLEGDEIFKVSLEDRPRLIHRFLYALSGSFWEDRARVPLLSSLSRSGQSLQTCLFEAGQYDMLLDLCLSYPLPSDTPSLRVLANMLAEKALKEEVSAGGFSGLIEYFCHHHPIMFQGALSRFLENEAIFSYAPHMKTSFGLSSATWDSIDKHYKRNLQACLDCLVGPEMGGAS